MKKSQLRAGYVEKLIKESPEGAKLAEGLKANYFIANSKEQFFIGYVTVLSLFKDISGPSIKVYSYLLMNYNSGILIAINMSIKKDILKFIKSNSKGVGVIDNCLHELCKNKLLYRQGVSSGTYMLNPRYAYKGSTKERNEALKSVILLGCKDC